MDEAPLWEQIKECHRMLDIALAECKSRGKAMVTAEAAYYTAKAEESFRLREEGYAVTFIELVIKGIPKVSEAMSAYHAAQVEYENAKEARQVIKKKHDALREQYAREWGAVGQES